VKKERKAKKKFLEVKKKKKSGEEKSGEDKSGEAEETKGKAGKAKLELEVGKGKTRESFSQRKGAKSARGDPNATTWVWKKKFLIGKSQWQAYAITLEKEGIQIKKKDKSRVFEFGTFATVKPEEIDEPDDEKAYIIETQLTDKKIFRFKFKNEDESNVILEAIQKDIDKKRRNLKKTNLLKKKVLVKLNQNLEKKNLVKQKRILKEKAKEKEVLKSKLKEKEKEKVKPKKKNLKKKKNLRKNLERQKRILKEKAKEKEVLM